MTNPSFSALLERQSSPERALGNGPKAHIIKRDSLSGPSAAAIVTEARINGTPLEALCGHVWVPSRDPKKLPLCEACEAIFKLHGDLGDHSGGDPLDLPS